MISLIFGYEKYNGMVANTSSSKMRGFLVHMGLKGVFTKPILM